MKIPHFSYLLLIAFIFSSCQTANLKKYSFKSRQMGVEFRIDVFSESDPQEAVEKAFDRIAALNQIMSDYLVDSELWKLSESSGNNNKIKVSDDLWKVLNSAQQFNTLSHGAFDITAGPYFLLWRKSRVIKSLPSARSSKRAANKVGMEKVLFNKKDRTVELTAAKMRLDLGGIAKGYAADEALRVLREEGVDFAMVDGSGDIAMTAHPEGSWPIFISDGVNESVEYIDFDGKAIATSGDAYQFVEIDGRRYSHIVDPKTGLGVTNRCRVTIIAPDCTTADALASTVTVLGPQKGMELVESLKGVEALVQQKESGKIKHFKSSGFPELIKRKQND